MSGVSPAYELGYFHDQLRAALSRLIGPDSMSSRLRRAGVRLSHFKNPERLPEQLGKRFVKIQEDLTSIDRNVGKARAEKLCSEILDLYTEATIQLERISGSRSN